MEHDLKKPTVWANSPDGRLFFRKYREQELILLHNALLILENCTDSTEPIVKDCRKGWSY